MPVLHITNGESVIQGFRAGLIPGTYLSWSDPLHDGPVPDTASLEDLSAIRAHALSNFGWGSYGEIREAFRFRDEAAAGFRSHDEIVFWFEHDLFDQLQLVQLLHWFSAQDLTGVRLSLIQINEHPDIRPFYGLGQLSGQQIAELLPARQPVSKRQMEIAQEAWKAFRAPDPTDLTQLTGREFPELPFLRAALMRFLEEYPSVHDGLSRMERQILLAASSGSKRRSDLYHGSQQQEQCPWADASVYLRLERLASGPKPALDRGFGDEFMLNEHGTRLLAEESDWVHSQNGIDIWLGGVHLAGEEAEWRWSEAEHSLRRFE